jgi:hypothetical protein
VQRARSVRPDLEVTGVELAAVAELVRRLDGLPLAIELAAARTRLLPPSALLERLRERLDVLSDGAVDLPRRQRTLRATIDWSYRLLGPDERRTLDRLSVFAGGATIEAAQAVCADHDEDLLEPLSSVLENSLLVSTAGDGEPRLRLLYTVRTYAAERLAERGETRPVAERHADWFLGRAELVDPIRHPLAHHRFELLGVESDDIRQAMTWALEQRDLARVGAFARATWIWFWVRGRLREVRPWFESAADPADGATDPLGRANVLYPVGQVREILGDAAGALEPTGEAIALYAHLGDQAGVAAATLALSAALLGVGRVEESLDRAIEARRIGERLDAPLIVGFATAMAATASTRLGDLQGARRANERSRRREAARLPHPRGAGARPARPPRRARR